MGRIRANQRGGQLAGAVPDNGTAYLQTGLTDSLKFSFVNGSPFGLFSVDLAEYSSGVSAFSTHFVGYRPDGSAYA